MHALKARSGSGGKYPLILKQDIAGGQGSASRRGSTIHWTGDGPQNRSGCIVGEKILSCLYQESKHESSSLELINYTDYRHATSNWYSVFTQWAATACPLSLGVFIIQSSRLLVSKLRQNPFSLNQNTCVCRGMSGCLPSWRAPICSQTPSPLPSVCSSSRQKQRLACKEFPAGERVFCWTANSGAAIIHTYSYDNFTASSYKPKFSGRFVLTLKT